MYSAIKRNRNIGTKKAGYKRQNSFIEAPYDRPDYEKRSHITREIHGRPLRFYIDDLKEGFIHSCSVEDVVKVLSMLPEEDVDGIGNIHFRQPTKKQNIHMPIWAAIYYYMGPDYDPVIWIDATKVPCVIEYKNSQRCLDQEREMIEESICKNIERTKRSKIFYLNQKEIREMQLTISLPHEVGHWKDYKAFTLDDRNYEEKEFFADRYAEKFRLKIKEIL